MPGSSWCVAATDPPGLQGHASSASTVQLCTGARSLAGRQTRPPTPLLPSAMLETPGQAAACSPRSDPGLILIATLPPSTSPLQWLRTLYAFSRPHTIQGTIISILSISYMGLGPAGVTPRALRALCSALVPSLLANVAIVGYNQLTDVEIDAVNKPWLPLPSGQWSMAQARGVTAAAGALALGLALAARSPPLLGTVAASLALGFAYSAPLPGLRWKRTPVLAAAAILGVRAVLVQAGFFLHMRGAGAGVVRPVLTRPILAASAVMLGFAVVIALFKDLPDMRGDAAAGVRTAPLRIGAGRVLWACVSLLVAVYAGAGAMALAGAAGPARGLRLAAAASQAAAAAWLVRRARQVDLASVPSLTACYMDVWKLFYLQYLIIPFLC
ncbi:hypothetical protein ACKKBG_A11025 [Auxenochlorella protothecoides x Auxenochlorella symbiontica]